MAYTAEQAGVKFEPSWNDENITLNVFCYNDGYHEFFAEIFKHTHTFVPTEKFFASKKEEILIAKKNKLLGEPYTR